MSDRTRPIGIFDSGVGGLTVLKEIIRELPKEHTIYLGDTARVPYGTRSPDTVIKYSFENTQFLMEKQVKLLVVACNTASSVSLALLTGKLPIPVIGVVEPGARAAVERSKVKKIAVIGTETTINSSSYRRAIQSRETSAEVVEIACPLFVPLVEEGWITGEVVTLTARKYLAKVRDNGADVLVLGCTHYPMIKDVISGIARIPLVDSAVETAREVHRILKEENMLHNNLEDSRREFFVTDSPEKFASTGDKFLGSAITNISHVTVGG
ncbi:glutamate racemase [bacterium]|nr:MAG: glutamate racemase [bacterium]